MQDQETKHEELNITNQGESVYILRLYVIGASQNSVRAINNIKKICETYLKGNYDLEIIDLYQQPLKAKSEQIIALPLLVKKSPSPQRKLIGDLSDTEKVLKVLGLPNND